MSAAPKPDYVPALIPLDDGLYWYQAVSGEWLPAMVTNGQPVALVAAATAYVPDGAPVMGPLCRPAS